MGGGTLNAPWGMPYSLLIGSHKNKPTGKEKRKYMPKREKGNKKEKDRPYP